MCSKTILVAKHNVRMHCYNIMQYNILFSPIFSLVGLWVGDGRRLTMVQEKNDGINIDMVLSTIQQNRPAVRALPARLSPSVLSRLLHVH